MFIIFLKIFYTPSHCGDFPYIGGRIQIEILGDSFSLPRETLPPFQGRLLLPSKGDSISLLRKIGSPCPTLLYDWAVFLVASSVAHGQCVCEATPAGFFQQGFAAGCELRCNL